MDSDVINDRGLISALLERKWVEQSDLTRVLKTYKQNLGQQKETLKKDRHWWVDSAKAEFQFFQNDQLIFTESLGKAARKSETWGQQMALLCSDEDIAEYLPQGFEPKGWYQNAHGTYLFGAEYQSADFFIRSDRIYAKQLWVGQVTHGAFDQFLAPDQSLLCVSDRAKGELHIFDLQSPQKLGTVKIRMPGSQSAMHVCFDLKRKSLWVTDSQSSYLSQVSLLDYEVTKKRPSLGHLSSLCLSPDSKGLFLLVLKPLASLIYLDILTLTPKKRFALEGELSATINPLPIDLMSINEEYLMLMSYEMQYGKIIPILSRLSLKGMGWQDHFELENRVIVHQLGEATPNRYAQLKDMALSDILEQNGLLSRDKFESLKTELKAKNSANPEAESGFLDLGALRSAPKTIPKPKNKAELPIKEQAEPQRGPLKVVPPLESNYELPDGTLKIIENHLLDALVTQKRGHIKQRPKLSQKISETAQALFEKLKQSPEVKADLTELNGGYELFLLLNRKEILIDLEYQTFLKTYQNFNAPQNCPQCHKPLMGLWNCQVCGFLIDPPDWAFKRKIASKESCEYLPPGHFWVLDPLALRIMELDPHHKVVWELKLDKNKFKYPMDWIAVSADRFLMLDAEKNTLFEVNRKGEILWELDTQRSPEHRLKAPIKVSYYYPSGSSDPHFLIVDRGNHRVLEVDRKHRIHWEYGVLGKAGSEDGQLNFPTDIQWTHERNYLIVDQGNIRILEVSPEKEIEKIFSASSDYLQSPIYAQRLFNGNTLFVDAGAFRLRELGPQGEELNTVAYYKSDLPPKFKLTHLIKMTRLPNQDLILQDEHKVIQVLPLQKRLAWLSPLDELFSPKTIPVQPDHLTIKPAFTQKKPPIKVISVQQDASMPQKVAQPVKNSFRSTLKSQSAVQKKKIISPKERLDQILNKTKSEIKASLKSDNNTESYEHSEIFIDEHGQLDKITPFIMDRRHNLVIRINRKGEVIWHYGTESGHNLANFSFVKAHKRRVLIADTEHDRILILSRVDKETLYELTGPIGDRLERPRSVIPMASGHYLIADRRKKRLIELTENNEMVWSFSHDKLLQSPMYAEELKNGNLLFADSILNRVLEIDPQGEIQWFYGADLIGKDPGALFGPEFATRLPNGHTLIANTRHHQVLEVDLLGKEIWSFTGQAKENTINPTQAQRLKNGNTLIAFHNSRKYIEVTPKGAIVWSYTMGLDIFLPPVMKGEKHTQSYSIEKLSPHYNAVEKRMIESARQTRQLTFECHITLMDHCQMKSVRASLLMMAVERFGTVLKTFPPPEELMADRFGKSLIITCILRNRDLKDDLQEALEKIGEVVQVRLKLLGI